MPPPTGVVSGPLMPTRYFLKASSVSSGSQLSKSFLDFLAGVDLVPGDLLLAAVLLGHRRVEHAHRGAPDVAAGAVAFDERNDRMIGHFQASIAMDFDGFTACGDLRSCTCHGP